MTHIFVIKVLFYIEYVRNVKWDEVRTIIPYQTDGTVHRKTKASEQRKRTYMIDEFSINSK